MLNIYWSKALPDQPGWCRFFRKYSIVQNLKRATIKQVIIHLSKLLKFIFRKSHYVTFLANNWKVPCQNTRLQFDHCWLSRVLDIQNFSFFHWFWMGKSIDLLVSEFFLCYYLSVSLSDQRVRGLASHQCKFHFDSMYGGLDMPYGSNNMKEGSLDVWIIWKGQMFVWKFRLFIFCHLGW